MNTYRPCFRQLFLLIVLTLFIPDLLRAQSTGGQLSIVQGHFGGFGGAAISDTTASAILHGMAGDPFVGVSRDETRLLPSDSGAVIISGMFVSRLVPVATLGFDSATFMRSLDSARTWWGTRTDSLHQSPDSVCQDDIIPLIAHGGVTYQWNTGDSINHTTVVPKYDTVIWVRAFNPGLRTLADTAEKITYLRSRPDYKVISIYRLSATVKIDTVRINPIDSGAVGYHIPIWLTEQYNLDRCMPDSLVLRFKVNRRMFKARRVISGDSLMELPLPIESLSGDTSVITIRIPVPVNRLTAGSRLAYLVGDVLLGNDSTSLLTMVKDTAEGSMLWFKKGNYYLVNSAAISSHIILDSLCLAGPRTRLLDFPASPRIDKIVPNPASTNAIVDVDLPEGSDAALDIYSLYGGQLASISINGNSAGIIVENGNSVRRSISIGTEELPNGIYQIVLRCSGRSATKLFIIER